MTGNALIPQEHIVSTEFDKGEGVLVDLNAKRYYTLNETAMLVWRSLEDGRPLPEIIEEITSRYEVTSDHAARSVERLLNDLQALKLVHPRQ
jgi:Coenzyme PQQ synthesis protein D (PqqD)